MSKRLLILLPLLLFVSCGSLRLSPQGCKSAGLWRDASVKFKDVEQELSEDYTVLLLDREVRLKDFLKERGVDCAQVKELRVRMESILFVKRKITVIIRK